MEYAGSLKPIQMVTEFSPPSKAIVGPVVNEANTKARQVIRFKHPTSKIGPAAACEQRDEVF